MKKFSMKPKRKKKSSLELDKPSTRYELVTSDNSNSAASIIADAILNESTAVQLVARSTGNNLDTEKIWELMSELDKDELQRNKIVHEL